MLKKKAKKYMNKEQLALYFFMCYYLIKEDKYMEELVKLITENGISVVCVCFMIYYILTTSKENNKILTTMTTTLQSISDRLEILEKSMLKRNKQKDDKDV